MVIGLVMLGILVTQVILVMLVILVMISIPHPFSPIAPTVFSAPLSHFPAISSPSLALCPFSGNFPTLVLLTPLRSSTVPLPYPGLAGG